MYSKKAFTVIELLFLIVVSIIIGTLIWTQINNIEIAKRNDKRRSAINAMYYNLEEVYYPAHKSYPRTIDEKVLVAMDKNLFTDPNGVKLGSGKSNYRYEPTNCVDTTCGSYSLRSILESEQDYVKTSRNR